MSFDLYFYKEKNSRFQNKDFVDYLNDIIQYSKKNEEWFYENENTEVYFSFAKDKIEDEEYLSELKLKNFTEIELSFNINYFRPDFFGLEAFPVVDEFIKRFNLFVINPQEDDLSLIQPKMGSLYKSWSKSNKKVITQHFEEFELIHFDKDLSDYSWVYNFKIEGLINEFGDDLYIPKIDYFLNTHLNQIQTSIIWPIDAPIVLPKVDFYLLTETIDDEPQFIGYLTIEQISKKHKMIKKGFKKSGAYFNFRRNLIKKADFEFIDSLPLTHISIGKFVN